MFWSNDHIQTLKEGKTDSTGRNRLSSKELILLDIVGLILIYSDYHITYGMVTVL